tara:strand:+ start:807 stop:1058 length:252 start_codon:yes stop_codon:yes gene_type:complete
MDTKLEDKESAKESIFKLSNEILLKSILFFCSMLIFISITVVFLYMALKKYDWQAVAAVGISDSLFGLVIRRITNSLFRTSDK